MKISTLINRLKRIRKFLNWHDPDGDEFAREEIDKIIDKLESLKIEKR